MYGFSYIGLLYFGIGVYIYGMVRVSVRVLVLALRVKDLSYNICGLVFTFMVLLFGALGLRFRV